MERVAFLVESTGERITCLLNPEHVVHRRAAGLAPAAAGGGLITGADLTDSPLLHTGGGRTELDLDLLFDVDLLPAPIAAPTAGPVSDTAGPEPVTGAADAATAAGAAAAAVTATGATTGDTPPGAAQATSAPAPPRDVRDLTRPLWNLTENTRSPGASPYGEGLRVPVVRFVWGKAWNMPAVVESLAERLERFDASGTPGRSWLRMRLVRVPEPDDADVWAPADSAGAGDLPTGDALVAAAEHPMALHQVVGAGAVAADGAAVGGQTLAEIAATHYPDRPWLWRWIAEVNGLTDVVWPTPGVDLVIPHPPEASA